MTASMKFFVSSNFLFADVSHFRRHPNPKEVWKDDEIFYCKGI